MSRSEVTEEEKKIRIDRAKEWAEFRLKFGFTQKQLSDTLTAIDTVNPGKCPGVSRRTVQQIEAALIKPHAHTLELFNELKKRHENNSK